MRDMTLAELIQSAAEADRAGRWDEALSTYESALVQAQSFGGASPSELMRRIGILYFQRGEFEHAEHMYVSSRAAAVAAGEHNNVASALNSHGLCRMSVGDLDHAQELYEEAQRHAEALGMSRLAVMIDQNMGMLANIRGDLTGALDSYRSALIRYDALNDDQGRVWVLNNMGMAHVDLEEWQAAESCFVRALELAEARGDADMVGTVQINRAELYLKQERFDDARACCDQAFEIFGRLESTWGLGETYKSYGVLYRAAGKLHLADAHLELVIEIAHESQNALLEAEAENERSLVALAQGKNKDALKGLNRAHRLFAGLKARREIVDIEKHLDRLESSYLQVVEVWGESIEAKDAYTVGHCRRVADYTCLLAEALGFAGRDLIWIRMGAFLHDVGKTAVPEEILNKPGRLTPEEWTLMQTHTTAGDTIVQDLDFPWDIGPIVRNHHEKWDGKGYPDRLSGNDIPITARILCIADVYDALTTERPYRGAFSKEAALLEMHKESGTTFDPALLAKFAMLVADLPLDGPLPSAATVLAA